MLSYVLHATVLGGLLSMISIPLLLAHPVPQDPYSLETLFVASWFGLTAGTAAAFYRVGYLFGIFARQHH
jgi:hypothetical protein